ncbi:MAG: hypothetical protein C4K60_18600 [Ideonella sp. MAG2]|nr:MAG: hypothetical protein C4K60_18600 [Ideonella sp. MAG2]
MSKNHIPLKLSALAILSAFFMAHGAQGSEKVPLPPMEIAPSLQAQSEPMPVSGDTGWMPDQNLRFGPYLASKSKRATEVRSQTSIRNGVESKERRLRTAFNLMREDSHKWTIQIEEASKISRSDPLDWLTDMRIDGAPIRHAKIIRSLFREDLASETVTRAELIPSEGAGSWQMVWRVSAQGDNKPDQVLGVLTSPQGDVWQVRQRIGSKVVAVLPNGNPLKLGARALELLVGDEVVATVTARPQGTVWIAKSLSADHQSIAAAWAGALLMTAESWSRP